MAPKRERKEVSRLTYDEGEEEKEAEKGSGTPLGEIEELKSSFADSKKYHDAILSLYQLVYKSKGKSGQHSRILKKFQGIVYGQDAETERARFEERASKLKRTVVEEMMSFLKIDKSPSSFGGEAPSKDMLVERLIDYLESPSKPAKKGKAETAKEKPAPKAAKPGGTELERACIVAMAKAEVEKQPDADAAAIIKSCEGCIDHKLPQWAKSLIKTTVEPQPDDDDDDDEPPAKKSKPAKKKNAASKSKKKDDADHAEEADDEPAEDDDQEAPAADEADEGDDAAAEDDGGDDDEKADAADDAEPEAGADDDMDKNDDKEEDAA